MWWGHWRIGAFSTGDHPDINAPCRRFFGYEDWYCDAPCHVFGLWFFAIYVAWEPR